MKLSDEEILNGWRKCDSRITRDYFYPYCQVAWYLNDKHYGLASKQDMDFYSLSHEYYIKLAKQEWKPLEKRNKDVSLRTYMINGFHFLVLDELKVYQRQQHLESFEERVADARLHFDLAEDSTDKDFREAIEDICEHLHDRKDVVVLHMRLLDGYKGKEISPQLGMTPSAVSQRYNRLWKEVVLPYFRGELPNKQSLMCLSCDIEPLRAAPKLREMMINETTQNSMNMKNLRTTPDRITSLEPNEVFVFGSNLAGMHGGGAARQALLKFGAVMGQGVGMQGQSYAIPTMQGGVETIRPYVDDFIAYARQHPEKKFLVTQIGCGIAGFVPEDIAPLFREAMEVENIYLPSSFWNVLE
jgi:RNA polymerase sigma factor (sigma-70 family)